MLYLAPPADRFSYCPFLHNLGIHKVLGCTWKTTLILGVKVRTNRGSNPAYNTMEQVLWNSLKGQFNCLRWDKKTIDPPALKTKILRLTKSVLDCSMLDKHSHSQLEINYTFNLVRKIQLEQFNLFLFGIRTTLEWN